MMLSCKDTKKTYSPKTSPAATIENEVPDNEIDAYTGENVAHSELDYDESEYDESEYEASWGGYFVTAQGGLLCRDAPGGEVIHTFSYGEEVNVIEVTDEEQTIIDEGEEISGNWVEVSIDDGEETGYVFDGFLASMTLDLDAKKIATLTPTVFIGETNGKGVILDGEHYMYDTALNVIGKIEVDRIRNVRILNATRFERPERKEVTIYNYWEEHCKWANFVTIDYGGDEYIVFGENVLQITESDTYAFNNETINLIHATSFLTKTGTPTQELSGCAAGYNVLIKSNEGYSFVKDAASTEEDSDEVYTLFFEENEYGSDAIYDEIVKNDTLYAQVSQSFQEGVGAYKLKIFKDGGWQFIEYDKTRDYEQEYN